MLTDPYKTSPYKTSVRKFFEVTMKLIVSGVAWTIFLFAEYSMIVLAIGRINAVWSYYQLFFLMPSLLVAILVFKTPVNSKYRVGLNQRLMLGAVLLLLAGVFIVAGIEIVWWIRFKPLPR
jgi:hypothetical protein